MNPSEARNEAERLVAHLRIFENAAEVLAAAEQSESGVREKEKRVANLDKLIEKKQGELQDLEDERKKRQQLMADEIARLERDQEARVRVATEQSRKETAEWEEERRKKLGDMRREIQAEQSRLTQLRKQVQEVEKDLEEKQKARDDFVKRVARV